MPSVSRATSERARRFAFGSAAGPDRTSFERAFRRVASELLEDGLDAISAEAEEQVAPEQLEWLALEKLGPERRAAGNTTLLANAVVGVDPVAALDAMFARSALLANRTWVRS